MRFGGKVVNKLKYGLLALFFLPFFSVGLCNADLMQDIMETADYYGTTIHTPSTAKGVGNEVFHEGVRPLDPLNEGLGIQKVPSMIVKVTRLLLSLVVALSVTMILYNGMTYIIQTGQGKEGKDLVKNVVYIVIGIIVSLFSITIITVLQSVSNSLDKESQRDRKRASDGKIIYNDEKKGILWGNSFNKRDGLDE